MINSFRSFIEAIVFINENRSHFLSLTRSISKSGKTVYIVVLRTN